MSATNEAPASSTPAPGAATVNDLELPVFDYTEPGLAGEVYHQRLADVRRQGWLARSPLTYVVLDRESGEFFLRARQTAFPGREIAEIFGVTGGRLREQIDANILNATGDRHRRLRALIGPAFTPRAADRWRPAMRGFLDELWRSLGDVPSGEPAGCEFVAAFAKPYPSLTIATVLGALWAADAWGGYWSWDPKETWALIVWLNYAAWLHMRLVKGLRGTVAAWWALAGLAVATVLFSSVYLTTVERAMMREPAKE